MSQYRQDGGGGPTTNSGGTSNVATAAGPGPNGAIEAPDTDNNSGTVAAGGVSTPGPGIPPPDSNSAGAASSVSTSAAPYHHHQDGGPSVVGPPPPTGPQEVGHAYPPYPAASYGGSAGPAGSEHAFGPRQQFGNPKQAHPPPAGPHRFMPGPPLTQPSGPTPTLNQLLQNPNPVPHRYQNNYTHPEQHYNQWPQKHPPNYGPGPAPPPGPYRQQQSFCPTYGGAGAGSTPSGYDSRTSWPGGPPGSPGQPQPQQTPNSQPQNSTSSVPVSQPSPQPPISHSPGPGPGPGGQMPPSPQHNHHQQPPPGHQPGYPSRPPPPTTPNTHAPDAADLSGGNSNDSSGGPAPGTPNSQSMRPTPSPTGSTGSRSMSPAVGQNIPMPPRPSSSQSDGGGGGGSGGGGGPPQRLSHSPMPPYGPPGQQGPHQGGPPYKGTPQNSSQMPMYQHQPGQYPGPGGQPGAYPPRPPGNFGPGAAAAAAAAASGAAAQGQGYGPQPGCPSPGPNLRPPHYLKHHLQHKMGFGTGVPPGSAPPSPGPPQNFHMAPPGVHHHSGMGPPPSMGPPMLTNNHPHEGGPMPPPSSTPNSHPPQMMNEMLDNGITTTPQSSMNTHVVSAAAGAGSAVTSVVTTGPDGTPIDEGSQQSTLSNASAASGEDPGCPQTPKSNRKNDMGGHYSHPSTPQGATSHEDYGEITSPGWPPRTPASPVFNSHVPPQDTYRSKKTDSLSKLYEMDDSPDRKVWLDKLLGFMEERRTPITTCPTISKNPLDLFRLYMYVKERGGFMEVTNNKTWKDIAGLLGIGASSSAAYTLRKHYTKNLLFYECQFDRGGIDPQPIINKVEASSKKKGAKAASVPSPGSSNSQDSFMAGGGGSGGSGGGPPSGASLDGYGGYNGYPPSNNPEYPQRPSSQSAPSPHAGSGGANHLNNAAPGGPSPAGGAADNVSVSNPFDDVSPSPPPPRGGPFAGGPHPPYPTGYPPGVRPVYPYSGDSSGAVPGQPNSGQTQPPPSSPQDPYRYNANPPGGYNSRPPYGGAQGAPGAPPPSQGVAPAGYSTHQDYYRQDQNSYPGVGPPNKNMPPPGQQPPRRHPDFTKDQPYPPYGQPRTPMYGGWPNNNQYRPAAAPYNTGSNQVPPPPQQWNQGSGVNASSRPGGGPWQNNQGYQQPQQPQQQGSQPGQNQWQPLPNQGGQAGSPMRPAHRPGKPFPPMMPPGGAVKGSNQQPVANSYGHGQMPKREITFPPDSVENVTPVLYRRKRICRADVGHVDAWRLIMCLRSGLLSESTYALDMLNILLFDDTSVSYFGLNQWPGLLDLLLEHFKRNLADMFDGSYPPKDNSQPEPMNIDLGSVVEPVDPCKKTLVFSKTTNYTLVSRRGDPVKFVDRPDDLFVKDNLKDWDIRGDVNVANTLAEIPTDPWYTNAEHILPNFQAEFGRIPFHTRLDDQRRLRENDEKIVDNNATSERAGDLVAQATPTSIPATIASVPPPKVISKKPARTKTLSDVISRIKKESSSSSSSSSEDNEKAIGMEVTSVTSETVKTEPASENSSNCEESASSSVDLNVSVNGECGTNEETLPKRVKEEKEVKPSDDRLKRRRRLSDYEDESYSRDDASLVLLTESQDNLGKRCVCISNILRSLTFIPGNETEFARSISYLALVGKLLLLQHEHPPRTQKTRNYDREEDADFADSCSSLQGEHEWWWDFLAQIRENILVGVSNIAGQIDCSQYEEEVARPLLDGLLHWAICPSATAQDPFASVGPASCSSLSPQRLALEALCKLCVTNSNVDLVIATPPFSRLEKLCAVLTKHLCRSEDQVLREFSINLLHYLAAADSAMSRVVASQSPCVSLLVAFIEQAEQTALEVANQRGITALRDNPDSMGTSLDMLRRAAATLVFLSRHPDNKPLLMQQESRLLALVMSQILDQQVASLISNVLFQISRC